MHGGVRDGGGDAAGGLRLQKLTIKPQVMQGGAEVTAAIVSDSLDIGCSSVEPLNDRALEEHPGAHHQPRRPGGAEHRAGVDVSKIRFIEVPFPDMPAAVKSGRVDAATAVEPFVTASEADGARKLLSFFAGVQPKMTIATYFASAPCIASHQAVVKRFVTAMKQSLASLLEHGPEPAEQSNSPPRRPSTSAIHRTR